MIANAVRQRVRIPEEGLSIRMQDGTTVVASSGQLAEARRGLPRNGTFHANRDPFLRRVLDFLALDRERVDAGEPPFLDLTTMVESAQD